MEKSTHKYPNITPEQAAILAASIQRVIDYVKTNENAHECKGYTQGSLGVLAKQLNGTLPIF